MVLQRCHSVTAGALSLIACVIDVAAGLLSIVLAYLSIRLQLLLIQVLLITIELVLFLFKRTILLLSFLASSMGFWFEDKAAKLVRLLLLLLGR